MAKKNPYATEAQNQSIVKYGPEISALTALLRQAQEDRDLRLRQAKSARQYTVGAVDAARPQVTSAYQTAQQAVTPAFAGGGGIEASALTARLGESQALAQSQLAARRVSAIEGEGAARDAALRDYRSDQQKIGQRATDLAQEQGAFTAQTISDLTQADAAAKAKAEQQSAQMQQSMTNALIGQGLLPDAHGNLTPLPGGKADPNAPSNQKPNKGKGWASTSAQSAASDEIQRLLGEASDYKTAGQDRGIAAQALLKGSEKTSHPVFNTVQVKHSNGTVTTKQVRALWQKGDKDADGNPIDPSLIGTQKTIDDPGFDAAKSQLLASAALDMAYDGHLSRRNQRLLHARGIKLEPLGLVTYEQWRKQQGTKYTGPPVGRPTAGS